MFTSRAEYRLQLREDNADLRLTEAGRRFGLVDDSRWQRFCEKHEAIEREAARLRGTWARPAEIPEEKQLLVFGKRMERESSLFDLLRRPDVSYRSLLALADPSPGLDPEVAEQVEIAAKYAGYIERQKLEVARQQAEETTPIPDDFDYAAVRGLSSEASQKLRQQRPQTVGQASRIQGITPAAISLLLVHLKRRTGAPPDGRARRA